MELGGGYQNPLWGSTDFMNQHVKYKNNKKNIKKVDDVTSSTHPLKYERISYQLKHNIVFFQVGLKRPKFAVNY